MLLPETATTGYRWQPELDETALRVAEQRPTAPPMPRGAPGARTVTVEALRPGPARLRLVRKRAWEQTAKQEFVVELDVNAA